MYKRILVGGMRGGGKAKWWFARLPLIREITALASRGKVRLQHLDAEHPLYEIKDYLPLTKKRHMIELTMITFSVF
jgi:hypothetical protein